MIRKGENLIRVWNCWIKAITSISVLQMNLANKKTVWIQIKFRQYLCKALAYLWRNCFKYFQSRDTRIKEKSNCFYYYLNSFTVSQNHAFYLRVVWDTFRRNFHWQMSISFRLSNFIFRLLMSKRTKFKPGKDRSNQSVELLKISDI